MDATTSRDVDGIPITPTGAPDYDAWLEPPDMTTSPTCTIEFRFSGERSSLTVRGDLEADALPALSVQIDQVVATPCTDVLLDLGAVRTLDAFACRALARLHHHVAARGGRMTILCSAAPLRRRLALYGLEAS